MKINKKALPALPLLLLACCCTLLLASSPCWADGPKDNLPENVRAVPPVGIELDQADLDELTTGLNDLQTAIDALAVKKDPQINRLLPDVEIFARAVRDGIKHRELFSPQDVLGAKEVLQEGLSRADALAKGEPYWTTQKGLVVRGFRSRLDQTVQPYGLVIPESYTFEGKSKYRLDLWFHGRGERSMETHFIRDRMSNVGRIAPADTIVLHPYGRYSNAFKFAGEVDVLEALEHAQANYRVDEDRIAVRGFSMGGAGCWQMAAHYPDMFFAANPGAGFSETPEFLKFFQGETLNPTWYETKLWQMYDCPEYVNNFRMLPTIAYSGELDIQKQAADIMAQVFHAHGMTLTHVIGPGTKHSIHPDSAEIIDEKLASLARKGRDRAPHEVWLQTPTLKYNRMHWLTVTRLGEHWKPARVHAKLISESSEPYLLITPENVTGLRFSFAAGESPFPVEGKLMLRIRTPFTSQTRMIEVPQTQSDRSLEFEIYLDKKTWRLGPAPQAGLHKVHNLQGPIDDAFMDSFIVVKPSGKARHAAVEKWANAELKHFVEEWRRQFRGDAVVKLDSELTKEDIASKNLILFGDPQSNHVLGSIVQKLPITWTAEEITVGKKSYDAAQHAPVMIYPNPLNPQRYVVLNSGFTYREFAYLNNARQVPKLPDWAVIDLRTPPDSLWPGKVVAADFFDESWQLKPDESGK